MRTLAVYICIIYFVHKTNSNYEDLAKNNPEIKLARVKNRPQGIFERFLQNLFDTLINGFPEKKLPKYMRILHRELADMEFNPTKKLSRSVKELTRMDGDEIKQELMNYRDELNKDLPHRISFLGAMNEVFTLRENMYFADYIYDLGNYGRKDKLFIVDETRNLLRNVIVAGVEKLSRRDLKDLKNKMKKAIKEYGGDSDSSSSSDSI